ncbi:MAG: hypothetical protein ACOYI4_10135, partial [Christensenellales bacterium]
GGCKVHGRQNIQDAEGRLMAYAFGRLSGIPGSTLYGSAMAACAPASFPSTSKLRLGIQIGSALSPAIF